MRKGGGVPIDGSHIPASARDPRPGARTVAMTQFARCGSATLRWDCTVRVDQDILAFLPRCRKFNVSSSFLFLASPQPCASIMCVSFIAPRLGDSAVSRFSLVCLLGSSAPVRPSPRLVPARTQAAPKPETSSPCCLMAVFRVPYPETKQISLRHWTLACLVKLPRCMQHPAYPLQKRRHAGVPFRLFLPPASYRSIDAAHYAKAPGAAAESWISKPSEPCA